MQHRQHAAHPASQKLYGVLIATLELPKTLKSKVTRGDLKGSKVATNYIVLALTMAGRGDSWQSGTKKWRYYATKYLLG